MYRVLKNDGIAVFAAWDKDPNSIAMKMFMVLPTLQGQSHDPLRNTHHIEVNGDRRILSKYCGGMVAMKQISRYTHAMGQLLIDGGFCVCCRIRSHW